MKGISFLVALSGVTAFSTGVCVLTSPALAQTNQVSVSRLRCEYLENPLGVDSLTPRLSWIVNANSRGWKQSAYRVQVASNPDLLKVGKADLWDSKRVASNQTLNIRYAGTSPKSGARLYWRVQVWGTDGSVSLVSPVQFWQMGLLKPTDWKAAWISAPIPRDTKAEGIKLAPPAYLRKTFGVKKPVKRATLYATARGIYEIRLNGAKVSDELLAPGWTDYNIRTQYQTYDVTKQLKSGPNAVGVIVADGWYSGYIGWGRVRDHYGTHTGILAQLDVEYTDGTHQLVSTDTSWQTSAGPIAYSDMLMGEFYDARKTEANWDTANFAAKAWKNAIPAPKAPLPVVNVTEQLIAKVKENALNLVVNNEIAGDPAVGVGKQLRVDYTLDGVQKSQTFPENKTIQIPAPDEKNGALVIRNAFYGDLERKDGATKLVGNHGPAIRVTQELKPVKITQPVAGNYVFDMGQNMVGVVRLKVRGAAGTKVKLRFAEMLNPNGTIYTTNLRGAMATDTYICRGGGEEIWEPQFTFHGFRYVEVTGFPSEPALDALTGRVIGSDTPKAGTFSSSSPMVNQLQSNIDWGQRGNFISVPTDCPQRDERLGWMGDAQIFVRTATFNRDVSAFFKKWMQDVEDAQTPDGAFSDVSPRVVVKDNGAPAWGDTGVIVPWTIYQAYADKEIINLHWNSMTRWMNYITENNPNGLWENRRSHDYGDWLSINADTPKDVIGTAYYAYDASLMVKMARATGRTAEAAKYAALFEKIKSAFNAAYVQNDGTVKGNTQTGYLMVLHFNLLPESLRPLAASKLVKDIEAKNNHLSTGFVGVGYLCPTLTDNGHNDTAYKLLLNDTFPSWGYSIKRGATTIWERWDGWTEEKGFQNAGMNSFNHYSLGSVGEWLYGHVAGIATDPNYAGFERIIIKPNPAAGLTYANATYDSIRGRIASNWKTETNRLNLDVTIPANTVATVYLPTTNAASVQEGGQAVAKAKGVRFLREEKGRAVYEIGSGNYKFSGQQ